MASAHRLLFVDDDPLVLQSGRQFLESHGYDIETATSGAEALDRVQRAEKPFALAILDYRLADGSGDAIARRLHAVRPELFVLIYSGDPSREAVQLSWAAGAVGFLEKGRAPQVLLSTIQSWCAKYDETTAVVEVGGPPTESEALLRSIGLVGRSRAMAELARKVIKYREISQTVLVLGETGTGKELIARALHPGGAAGFFAVNCATFAGNAELLESELFGHERGAFTGAHRDRPGIFEEAKGGTIFLDEIHHLSLGAQAKLLRVCQEKRIRRLGGNREFPVSFRLVAASKPELEERCTRGEFLADLYHRLSVLWLPVPPLRERPEDVEPLIAHFCERFEAQGGIPRRFLKRTAKCFELYPWPGNVRELENAVIQLLTDTTAEVIRPEALPPKFFQKTKLTPTALSLNALKEKQEDERRELIQYVLETSRSKAQAAKRLAVSPTTLQSILERLGLA